MHFVMFPKQIVSTYPGVERCTVRVKCLAQQHNTISPAGLKPELLNLEASTQTISPLCLHSTEINAVSDYYSHMKIVTNYCNNQLNPLHRSPLQGIGISIYQETSV